MTDIVDRLNGSLSAGYSELRKEAALEIERLRAENAALVDDMNLLRNNNTALRAKITEMEKQAPTHWSCNVLQADASWKEEVGREIPPDGYYSIRDIKPLYALPGAKGE